MKEYKLKIKVTKDILKQSMMCSEIGVATNCAIALAVREIFPNAYVGKEEIHPEFIPSFSEFKQVDKNNRIMLPSEASAFINEFDSLVNTPQERLNLPELEFEVTLPEEYINSINIDEVKEILKDSKTLELV